MTDLKRLREAAAGCTLACWAMPDCPQCGMRKKPRGRDAGVYASSAYCGHDCSAYYSEPRSGHFWPGEEPERKAACAALAELDGVLR